MDEAAERAGLDAVFRLAHLSDERSSGHIKLHKRRTGEPVAQRRPRDRFCTIQKQSAYCAVLLKAHGRRPGHTGWAAADAGEIINLSDFMLGAAVSSSDGLTLNRSNFIETKSSRQLDKLPDLKISEVPQIDIELRPTRASTARAGETSVGPTVAIGNAVRNA